MTKIKHPRPKRMARIRRAQRRRAAATAAAPTTLTAPPGSAPVANLTPLAPSPPAHDADETIRWNYTPDEWAWFDGWAQRRLWLESTLYVGGFVGALALLLVFMAIPPDTPTSLLLIYIPLVVIWAWQGYRRVQDLRVRHRLHAARRRARRQGPRQVTVRDTAIWEAGQRLPLGRPYSILHNVSVARHPPDHYLLRFDGTHGTHRATRFTMWVPVPPGDEASAEAVVQPFLHEEVQP